MTILAQPSVASTETPAVDDQRPTITTEPRTLTYQLYGGGSLRVPCPAWCTSDHESDLNGQLHPVDLCHEGDEIAISFTTGEGTTERILAARITQYPFCTEGDDSERPHMALMPVKGSGETLGYQSAGEVYAEIQRVRKHLLQLQQLTEQLAEARAEDHAAVHRGASRPTWMSLRPDDVQTMPIQYVLKAFDAGVVDLEPDEVGIDGEISSVYEGDIVILLRRDLPQPMREQAIRKLLLGKLYARPTKSAAEVQA
jgi:hypothetical protein